MVIHVDTLYMHSATQSFTLETFHKRVKPHPYTFYTFGHLLCFAETSINLKIK
jgi:hypothetical protein